MEGEGCTDTFVKVALPVMIAGKLKRGVQEGEGREKGEAQGHAGVAGLECTDTRVQVLLAVVLIRQGQEGL